jgi:hypothetical protein
MTRVLDEVLQRIARKVHPQGNQVTHELQPREIGRPCPECGNDGWEALEGGSLICLTCGHLSVELPDPAPESKAVTANQIYEARRRKAK